MPDKIKLGVGLFLLSEANCFLILLIVYIYFHSMHSDEPSAAGDLSRLRTLAFSSCLFLSSATIYLAARSFKMKQELRVSLWLSFTIALGSAFLFGQWGESVRLFSRDITISSSLFGSTFFALTGFHGLHVVVGLCALGVLFVLAVSGRIGRVMPSGFEALSMYWHFVVALWLVMFAVLCLWP